MIGDPRSRTSIRGDAGALRSEAMEDMFIAFNQGQALGFAPDAIYRDLERARIAYLRPFTSGVPTPAQYDMLVENLARCHDGEYLWLHAVRFAWQSSDGSDGLCTRNGLVFRPHHHRRRRGNNFPVRTEHNCHQPGSIGERDFELIAAHHEWTSKLDRTKLAERGEV